jgi:hypothetical protein
VNGPKPCTPHWRPDTSLLVVTALHGERLRNRTDKSAAAQCPVAPELIPHAVCPSAGGCLAARGGRPHTVWVGSLFPPRIRKRVPLETVRGCPEGLGSLGGCASARCGTSKDAEGRIRLRVYAPKLPDVSLRRPVKGPPRRAVADDVGVSSVTERCAGASSMGRRRCYNRRARRSPIQLRGF